MWRNDDLETGHRSSPGTGWRARSLVTLLALSSITAGAATAVDLTNADTSDVPAYTGASCGFAG